jgi:hypothetical protein
VKRAALSILCGVAFPFCYAAAAGPLSTYVEDRRIRLLLEMPVKWPRHLYSYLFIPFIGDSLLGNEAAFFLFIIGSDVLLYTFVIYFALLLFSVFRRAEIKGDAPPPPPRSSMNQVTVGRGER